MKYGLREDKAFRKKEEYRPMWKKMVEDDIQSLKIEVAIGKAQLKELNKKLELLTINNQTCSLYKFKGKDEWKFPTGGTRLFKFRVEHDHWLQSNYMCMTIMPEYNSWSPEELRWADYMLANSQQYNQLMNVSPEKKNLERKRRTRRTIAKIIRRNNRGPTWPYSGNGSSSNADIKKKRQDKQWSIVTGTSSASACSNHSKSVSKVEESRVMNNHEELLDKVLSELKDVNKTITSVDSRMCAVETNLSEISMQVSILDSKLNAEYMLVTMDKLEKKWHTLKPWIASIENTPAKNNMDISFDEKVAGKSAKSDEISNVKPLMSCHSSPHSDCSFTPINIEDSSKKSIALSGYENEVDMSGSAQITSTSFVKIVERSTFSNSVKLEEEDDKIKNIESLPSDNNNIKPLINTSDTSSTVSSSNKIGNNDPEVHDVIIDEANTYIISNSEASITKYVTNFYSDLFLNSEKEKNYSFSDINSMNQSRNFSLNTTNNSEGVQDSSEKKEHRRMIISNDDLSEKERSNICGNEKEPEHVCLNKQTNIKISDVKDNCTYYIVPSGNISEKEIPNNCASEKEPKITLENNRSDIENEYVIVQSKDVEDIPPHLEERDVLLSPIPVPLSLFPYPVDRDFQVCSNVTEYLEVNLGKKKDETYKFSFQTKPENPEASCPILSPLSNNGKNENELKISLSIKDDSFNTFLSDFKKKDTPGNKQSSPLVANINKSEALLSCQLQVQKSDIN